MSGSILITGAGRGLGSALVIGLAAKGFPIVAMGRDLENLQRVIGAATEAGGVATAIVGDARDSDALADAVRAAEELPGGLYGVIANAGIAGPTLPVHQLSDHEWGETLEVNLTAAFRLCREALPPMLARGSGRVILIGSVTGKRPLAGRTPYAASKLGLVGLARTLAVEVGPHGITANVISPWLLEGERLDSVIVNQAHLGGRTERDVRLELVTGTATRHTVTDDDVLASVEFLLDPRSGALTGQDFNVAAGAVMY